MKRRKLNNDIVSLDREKSLESLSAKMFEHMVDGVDSGNIDILEDRIFDTMAGNVTFLSASTIFNLRYTVSNM